MELKRGSKVKIHRGKYIGQTGIVVGETAKMVSVKILLANTEREVRVMRESVINQEKTSMWKTSVAAAGIGREQGKMETMVRDAMRRELVSMRKKLDILVQMLDAMAVNDAD
jgi:hypothetical protein